MEHGKVRSRPESPMVPRPVLDRLQLRELREFMWDLSEIGIGGEASALIYRAIQGMLAFYNTADLPKERTPLYPLEKRWYDSLATGTPDWSVYAEPESPCTTT